MKKMKDLFMKKFENLPKWVRNMYIIYLLGTIVFSGLFVFQIFVGKFYIHPVYSFMLMICFIGLFRVISTVVYEYKRNIKKHGARLE